MTKYLNARHGIEILHKDGLTQILAGNGDPSTIGREASIGSVFLRSDNGGGLYTKIGVSDTDWLLTSSGTNIENFSGLLDTPENYYSAAGKLLMVNSTASGIEFISTIDGGNFI